MIGIRDLKHKLSLETERPTPGTQDEKWHQQVLGFLELQRMNSDTSRKELAEIEANRAGKAKACSERIIKHERLWIMERTIPPSKQGRHAKVDSLLDDEGTRRAMKEYVERNPESANAEGLAHAVLEYWKRARREGLTDPSMGREALPARTVQRWFDRMGYQWRDLRKKKGLCRSPERY